MTINEASNRYHIPIKILKEYESWGLCSEVKKVMGTWNYDDSDIERLSTIMTLHDIGFSNDEVREYWTIVKKVDRGMRKISKVQPRHARRTKVQSD
ncbi:MAG TPA: MerR family transcriptional regulator [Candidatus Avimonoglobus intestinipullorum]|uniref:MerR family transcriptional regulator n=1 Tax=Candidatus Avimonoglobus intestinipullorum TaxID=2840699 RepID=A0A9D1LW93_9FIRM|nr:MerR family transcriptional regulator [Candidatus Avimonoglobus intestinipullorum]